MSKSHDESKSVSDWRGVRDRFTCDVAGVGITSMQAQASAPLVDELVRGLDRQETQWVATAHLLGVPDAAIPRLLEPGRAVQGPHDQWTPALLALAQDW